MHASITSNVGAKRPRVIADGSQCIADLAQQVCGDPRLAALLRRLNPRLPAFERLPAGTEVMCPTSFELQHYRNTCRTYSDEDAVEPSSSRERRPWSVPPTAPAQGSGARAEELARALLASGTARPEVSKRLARECSRAELSALAQHRDAALRAAGDGAELLVLYPVARRRLRALRALLQASTRAGGMRAVLEALGRSAADTQGLLEAILVAPALRAALAEAAPGFCALLGRARELTQLERGARDASLRGQPPALTALVAALADGVEVLAGERLDTFGLSAEHQAFTEHLTRLDEALASAERALPRSPAALRALAGAVVGPALPRPWPLVLRLNAALSPRLEALPATVGDEGLGGLVPRKGTRVSAEGEPVLLRPSELAARAASCARIDDEGDALAARLAPTVLELYALVGPALGEGGPAPVRRARRRLDFDQALTARGAVSGAGVATLVEELLARARAAGVGGAERVRASQLAGALDIARALPVSLSVQRRPLSELGRALVVAALTLDRELGACLARPTGREALAQTATRHAARLLSAAACRLAVVA